MSNDPNRQRERRISTDRDTIRGWADQHEAVPVRHKSGDTERIRLVPESEIGSDHERMEWDTFHDELEREKSVVFYHGETADEPFEVTTHDEAIAQSDIDDEQFRERLVEGETITTEIKETTVVETVVVEESTIESELIGTDIVDQQVLDVELVERGCSNCDLVEDRETDADEWFDTDRYLASLQATREQSETESTADVGETSTDREYPYYAELDVEETWAVTREITERFTVESRIVDTDVTEAETVEDHDIDVQGLQRSILEQGLLGIDHDDPDTVMAEFDVESELGEVDRVETHFERTRTVEDDVVDKARVRADITSADLTDMEVVSEHHLTSEMEGQTAGETSGQVTGESASERSAATEPDDRVELTSTDVDKDVVDANGDKIGTVDTVTDDGNAMTIDTHAGITEKIMSALDWGDNDKDNTIYAGQIARITDDEVQLKEHEELGEHRNVDKGT